MKNLSLILALLSGNVIFAYKFFKLKKTSQETVQMLSHTLETEEELAKFITEKSYFVGCLEIPAYFSDRVNKTIVQVCQNEAFKWRVGVWNVEKVQ